MEETFNNIIGELADLVAKRVASQITTTVELKQYPENMDLSTAADYVGLNKDWLRRNLNELGIKYRKAGDKYLFRKNWLDEWMEAGANQIQKNKNADVGIKVVKYKAR